MRRLPVFERGYVHFSAFAVVNCNETSISPAARGRFERSRCAKPLARLERPVTVISESPDEESSQAIRSVLETGAASSSSRAT